MIARIAMHATKADVHRICADNPGWRIELDADGVISMSPPTGSASGARSSALNAKVYGWAREHGFKAFDSSAGFELPDGSIVSPDASLVRLERWRCATDEEREEFAPLVPDVAIELVSKSDSPAILRAKLLKLRDVGASFVLLIDPYRRALWNDGTPPANFPTDFHDVMDAGGA